MRKQIFSPQIFLAPLFALLLLMCGCVSRPTNTAGQPAADDSGVKITDLTNVIRIEINGKLFTEYHFKDADRPYFYPVISSEGQHMTRNWPMASPPDEEHDHPHHRGLWCAHSSVNGLDFWNEGKGPKIVHDGFTEISSGQNSGVIKSRDKWIATNGDIVCTDDRTFRVYNYPSGRLFDFDVTIHAPGHDAVMGDDKDGFMAIRLAETMRLKGPVGHGHIVNSEGVRDGETWGKHAEWCDYYGPVDDKIVGVAIFDNPNNPRHPTTWHVRDYGLFAANPFGLHDFEKKPAHTGDMTIPAGQSVTFRYRFYIHAGDDQQGKVAEVFKQYLDASKK